MGKLKRKSVMIAMTWLEKQKARESLSRTAQGVTDKCIY